jgi:hypothetical protein
LQRKLEERTPEHVQMIFSETHVHVVELMTGLWMLSSPIITLTRVLTVLTRSFW